MTGDHFKVNHQKYTANNRVRLIHGGKEYFDLLLNLIAGAKDSIHLQVYVYDDDETGIKVADALKAAVQRKVKVYLLADGYASQVMSQKFIDDLRNAGIQFRFFETILKSKYFYFGRRLHHKVIVIDNRHALVGGINISDRYNDLPGHPAWLDFALHVEGEIVQQLCELCWKTWKGFPLRVNSTPCSQKELQFNIPEEDKCFVRMRRNDWVRRKNEISRSYIEMLKNAQKEVTILCSYFLPGRVMRQSMIQALNRGIKIKVVLAGLSDVKLAKKAERYIYNWMLRKKIRIFEYQGAVLHGKVAVCDNEWLTLGSYNINNISAYASIELNLDVFNASFAKKVDQVLEQIIQQNCLEITEELLFKTSTVFKRLVRWSSYQLIKFLFFLFTFYFREKN